MYYLSPMLRYCNLWGIARFVFVGCIMLLAVHRPVQAQVVYSVDVSESVNPASAEFILHSIEKSERDSVECIVINLNTPGGLLNATRDVVSKMLSASVPIVVYVSPSGARAGSAGVFITMAANIAAMAPGTNIGAAHPVNSDGKNITGVMNEKITNDAAAFIRTIAEKRNRNVLWAEDAVRLSVSITETEAVSENVVNMIADNRQDLLQKINGLTVQTASGTHVLRTANAEVTELEMGFFSRVLSKISDPNIAYILMMLGFFGIVFELFNPGAILPGIFGVVFLILAFYSMSSLPVNYASVGLIVFGIILYLLEIKVVSHGMLAIGGTVSVLLGSMFLFRTSSVDSVATLSWTVIITTTLMTLLFFLFIIGLGLRAQKHKPTMGENALIGRIGIALTAIKEKGMVKVVGESWRAVSEEGNSIPKGSKVVINRVEGLTLYVSRTENEENNIT